MATFTPILVTPICTQNTQLMIQCKAFQNNSVILNLLQSNTMSCSTKYLIQYNKLVLDGYAYLVWSQQRNGS